MNYNNLHWYPMPECRCPMDFHRRYWWAYPGIEYDVDDDMIYPMMYPHIYYKIYPYVHRVCDLMDNPYVPYPSQEQIESMVNECYDMCMREMPELEEYAGCKVPMNQEVGAQQFVFRRPILRDLIAIILISELFRRRRRRRF